jgi:hypothetical protein
MRHFARLVLNARPGMSLRWRLMLLAVAGIVPLQAF